MSLPAGLTVIAKNDLGVDITVAGNLTVDYRRQYADPSDGHEVYETETSAISNAGTVSNGAEIESSEVAMNGSTDKWQLIQLHLKCTSPASADGTIKLYVVPRLASGDASPSERSYIVGQIEMGASETKDEVFVWGW